MERVINVLMKQLNNVLIKRKPTLRHCRERTVPIFPKYLSTVVPRDTNLIRSVTLLVRQIARISKQFSPFKLIEMILIRSSTQNAAPVVVATCFLKKKNVFIHDKYCIKT